MAVDSFLELQGRMGIRDKKRRCIILVYQHSYPLHQAVAVHGRGVVNLRSERREDSKEGESYTRAQQDPTRTTVLPVLQLVLRRNFTINRWRGGC